MICRCSSHSFGLGLQSNSTPPQSRLGLSTSRAMLSTVSPLVAAAPLMQASFGLSDLVYRQLGLMAEKVFKWPDTSPIGDSNAGALTHFRYHSIILSAGSKRGDSTLHACRPRHVVCPDCDRSSTRTAQQRASRSPRQQGNRGAPNPVKY